MRRSGILLISAVLVVGGFWSVAGGPAAPPPEEPPMGLFPLAPGESAGAVRVPSGFVAELFAAEPHMASPVAMAFDPDGDVYVAEMLDYPIIRTPGMFGPFPEGQIRRIRTDEHGKVVGSSVFATAIAAPTSVLPYDGGVLVSAAPDILFLKDTDGDGHADIRRVVLTGFDTSQDLYRVNSLIWGVDGWIYARGVGDTPIHWGDDLNGPPLSTAGMNFRFRPRQRAFEPVSGMSSCFGLTMDDWGHLFFSNSANHVYQVVLPDRYLRRNPYLAAPALTREISDHGGVAPIHRISRPQPWRVERSEIWDKTGLTKKYFGTIEPRQDYMTATCGPLIYRESAFPPSYRGSYFVCEAVSNLVHRDVLRPGEAGPAFVATRGEEGREFLASADNWCSPVYLAAGPDGALYVVDMYRQIIEHAGPDGGRDVPNVPLEVLQKHGLRTGSTMGRIYRVAADGMPRRPRPNLSRATPARLADALGSPDAWWRSAAQGLILEKPDAADVPAIVAIAGRSRHAAARVQALWTLHALGKLDDAAIARALKDEAPGVRENALRMAEDRLARSPELALAARAMVDDPDPTVRFQLALSLGDLPAAGRLEALAALAGRDARDRYVRAAVLSSAGDDPLGLYRILAGRRLSPGVDALLSEAAEVIGSRRDRDEIAHFLESVARGPEASRNTSLRGLAAGIRRRGRKDLDSPVVYRALQELAGLTHGNARAAVSDVAGLVGAYAPGQREAKIARESRVALDEGRGLEERLRAVEALGSVESPAAVAALGGLLHPRNPEPLQLAALGALGEQPGAEVVRVLAENWRGLAPALRARAAEVALSHRDRLGPLLEMVRAGRIPAEAFDPSQRVRLAGSGDRAIAEAARAAFGASDRKLDPGLFDRYKAALDLKGEPKRGVATFRKLCIACHKVGGEGADVGPALASVKNRPRDQILRDILYPSMTFAPQYHQYVAATTEGRLVTGLIVASNASNYTIRRQGGEETTLLRRDVEELRDTQTSLMPEKLLDGLAPQEVADLLDFVRSAE